MFKGKVLFIVAIHVITLTMIASSCAPAATTAPATTPTPTTTATTPATTPPATTVTPPAAPAPPAATIAPVSVTHSWGDSKTYTNDAVGFTVDYPAKWITKDIDDAAGGEVQKVAAGTDPTADGIYIYVVPAVTDMAAAAVSGLNNSPTFQQYKAKATLTSSKPFTLTCGTVTDATAGELSAKIVIYQLYFYAIGVTKGDKSIMVLGSTTGGGNAKKQIQEICQSLCFK